MVEILISLIPRSSSVAPIASPTKRHLAAAALDANIPSLGVLPISSSYDGPRKKNCIQTYQIVLPCVPDLTKKEDMLRHTAVWWRTVKQATKEMFFPN